MPWSSNITTHYWIPSAPILGVQSFQNLYLQTVTHCYPTNLPTFPQIVIWDTTPENGKSKDRIHCDGIQRSKSNALKPTIQDMANTAFNASVPILERVHKSNQDWEMNLTLQFSDLMFKRPFRDKETIMNWRIYQPHKFYSRYLYSMENNLFHEATHSYWGFGTEDQWSWGI